jgi:L-rhamnonate dehydratase
MKITAVRLFQLEGIMGHQGEFWEERLVRPVDIYPEHKTEGPTELEKVGDNAYRITAHFVEIETDAGISGIGGPMPADQTYLIGTQLAPAHRPRSPGQRTPVGSEVPPHGAWPQGPRHDGHQRY